MAVRRLAEQQPDSFAFTPENRAWAEAKISDYPEGRQASAVIPILWRAQEQNNGWLPEPAIRLVADMLDMPYIRVFEVATFYTMFQLGPVGSVAHVNVCGTTPCMLRGSEDLIKVCKKRIAERPFELSEDGRFSWEEVECAGACVNAPMVQIGSDTFEDLTAELFEGLLDALADGKPVTPGPQSARQGSEPLAGATTLFATNGAVDAAPGTSILEPAPAPAEPPAPSEPEAKPAEPAPAPAEAIEVPALLDALVHAVVTAPAAPTDATAAARADAAGERPPVIDRDALSEADNLQTLSGVGKVLEGRLHSLGIHRFEQIAAWTEAHKEWVNAYIDFKGRIDRENWIGQAKDLVAKRQSDD